MAIGGVELFSLSVFIVIIVPMWLVDYELERFSVVVISVRFDGQSSLISASDITLLRELMI